MGDIIIRFFPQSDKFEELHQGIWFGKFGAAAMEAKAAPPKIAGLSASRRSWRLLRPWR